MKVCLGTERDSERNGQYVGHDDEDREDLRIDMANAFWEEFDSYRAYGIHSNPWFCLACKRGISSIKWYKSLAFFRRRQRSLSDILV